MSYLHHDMTSLIVLSISWLLSRIFPMIGFSRIDVNVVATFFFGVAIVLLLMFVRFFLFLWGPALSCKEGTILPFLEALFYLIVKWSISFEMYLVSYQYPHQLK